MNSGRIRLAIFATFLVSVAAPSRADIGDPLPGREIHLAQGMIAGEVTATSVILQTRLAAVAALTNGDVAGAEGSGRFELATSADFKDARPSPWMRATADRDFILKARIDGLLPATTYHYRVILGSDTGSAKTGNPSSFKTLQDADRTAAVDFILTSCPNYAFFHHGTQGIPAYQGEDRMLGYPALEAIRRLDPDFVIMNGDCVYYDHPQDSRAKTQAELRRKWHEQHVQPRFAQLFARTPTYWLKDDASKKDNHVNEGGFRREGEEFFSWLKECGIAPNRFLILCGDRHWKYHSRHPGGYEELSSGALNRENARLGRAPGTPGSSDPDGRIRQLFTDSSASGSFLRVRLEPAGAADTAVLEMTLHDDKGEVVYRHATR